MRLKASIAAWAAAAALLGPAAAQAAAFTNGSFEENLDGWTTDDMLVSIPFVFDHRDAANAPDQEYNPVDGFFFAAMLADQGDAPVTLSQTFTTDGGVFSGWAAFLAEDALPLNDGGYVRIFNASTNVVLFSSDIAAVGDYGFTPWTHFSTRLAAGEYTIEAGVTNGSDEFNPSLLLVDNFSLTPVPEPASWALMIAGLGGVGALVRRRRDALA